MFNYISLLLLINLKVIIMEKCKKVCKDVRPSSDDEHGNHYFWIDFTDNTSGLFGCKNQDLFQVGAEAEFYLESKVGKSGKEYSKIRRVSAVEYDDGNTEKKSSTPLISGSGSAKSQDQVEQINRSASIRSACTLFQGQKIDREYVIETAEMFFDYINFGVGGKEEVKPTDGTEVSNELPF